MEILAKYAGDLIALAGDETSLGALKEIFPKRLYMTLPDPARGLPRNKLEAQGFTLASKETQKDGRIHLVLRRMAQGAQDGNPGN